MADPTFYFDAPVNRFRGASGKFVSEKTVRATVDAMADGAASDMAALSRRLVDGSIKLPEWQAGMRDAIKISHTSTSVIALGGRNQMDATKWGSIGHGIRDQYGYLSAFAADIESGAVPPGDGLVARAELYGQASRSAFETQRGRGDRSRGYQAERNILDGAAAHCDQCAALSDLGWVEIGSLPGIGSRSCQQNDRCTIERRFKAVEA